MATTHPADATNWFQVGLATLAQNFATGLAFGSFGTIVLSIEKEYGADRAASSLALSLMVVSLSGTASLLGRLLERISIRVTMMTGATLGAVGFMAASLAPNAWWLMAAYFALLGPATAMLGIVPSMTLASRWTTESKRGLAMGILNMPILVMLVPLGLAQLLHADGVRTVYRVLACADVALFPVLLLVRDKAPPAAVVKPARAVPAGHTGSIVGSPVFWVLVIAQGLLVGAGTMKLAHFVPLLTEQGRTFDEANMLLAISGGSGLFGSFVFGALADRIGGIRSLICNAVIQAGMWTIFLAPVSFGVLLADAIVVGACGAGLQSAYGVALSALFGDQRFSRALGLSSLFTLPFLFGLTPLASVLYKVSGNYHLPMGMMIGGFLVAAILLSALIRRETGARRELTNAGAA